MTTIIESRIQELLNGGKLAEGSHGDFTEGACAMEWVSYLAGLGFTDAPECASKVLRSYTISLNDTWNDIDRQRLVPFLPRMIGTANDGKGEARSYLALDWLIRTYTPAFLDLAGLTVEAQRLRDLRRIVDLVSAQAAGPVVRAGRNKASAARAAARDAARAAAWDAAWAAAWDAAGDAAGDAAADAAWDAAWDAAGDAAGDAAAAAAWDAAAAAAAAAGPGILAPTVEALKASALELLDAMIDPDATR